MRLLRLEHHYGATLGMLYIENEPIFSTLELPWKQNRRNVSCIPAGTYAVSWTYSPKFDRILPVLDEVPGRSFVRMHPGNTVEDIEGCILIGTEFRRSLSGKPYVTQSQKAFDRFLQATHKQPFKLTINWVFDSPEE